MNDYMNILSVVRTIRLLQASPQALPRRMAAWVSAWATRRFGLGDLPLVATESEDVTYAHMAAMRLQGSR